MKYKYIKINEMPSIIDKAAEWFSSKWNVPKKAYLDCMTAYIDGDTDYGWYLCLDEEKSSYDELFAESSWLVKRNNKYRNEKRLGVMYGFKGFFNDATSGSPVIEIGYNQVFLTYLMRSLWRHKRQTEVVPR